MDIFESYINNKRNSIAISTVHTYIISFLDIDKIKRNYMLKLKLKQNKHAYLHV